MSQAPVNAGVYYKDLYWNDHPLVLEYLKRLVSSADSKQVLWWPEYFRQQYAPQRKFKRALFLNCGNGWVERELYALGLFECAEAFDYSESLLKQARESAGAMPCRYFQADCNTVDLQENHYDLIVNVAALHHVQYIDRLTRQLARCLSADGLMVNFDYVGPHRNQYPAEHFELLREVNQALPGGFSHHPLGYPHLETMLATDPTEAIHSELIRGCFERYFLTVERRDLNGAIAYAIMHNNGPLFGELPAARACVQSLIELDQLCTAVAGLPCLFSFWVGRSRKQVLLDAAALAQFSAEEQEREQRAAENGGRYLSAL